MGMLGNQLAPGTQFAVTNDSYNGDGSTTAFTLSQSVSATTDIEVIVDNVQQSPHDGSYSVSGTALTFSEAPATGTNNIYVIYHGSRHHTTAQVIPDDGSVHSSKIANNAVTPAKLHTDVLGPITVDATNNRVGINTTTGPESFNTTGNIRLQTNNTVKLEYLNTSGAYVTGTTGGAALGFEYLSSGADHEIFFETHNGGVSHREVMRIDKDGYVRTPYMPHSVVQYLGGGNGTFVGATVTFNTVHENVGNMYNSSNGRFTAPVAGRYLICVNVLSGTTNGYGLFNVRKNGSYFLPGTNGWVQVYTYGTSNDKMATYSTVETLAINDYLDLYIHPTHDHFHWNNYNRMSVTMIG